MLFKYAAPVAAFVASAAAQSSCSFTATTVSDANNAITSCTAISGDVTFVQGAAAPMITLAAKQIVGKLTYQGDSTVTQFSADNLASVGDVMFSNLSSLNSISFKSLTQSGNFIVEGLGGLATINTGTQFTQAQNIAIVNTQLAALDAFKTLTMITGLTVQGNLNLGNISMNIANASKIDVGNNEVANNGLSVQFDNLTSAETIIIRNASSVSLANLGSITGSMQFIDNTFESFAAPNLTWSGLINFSDNNKLTNISLPQLTAINGTNSSLVISNNTGLQTVGGWPQLTQIKGALFFAGSFTNVTDLTQIKQISGALSIKTTGKLDDSVPKECSALASSRVVVAAKPTCQGNQASSSTGGAGGSGSGSGSGGSSSSSAAAGIVNIPALPSLSMGLGAALLQFLLSF